MKKNIAGAAALPSILLLSGIIAEIILAVIVVAGLFSRSGFGARLSAEATAAAYAGAEDGIYRTIKGDAINDLSYNFVFSNNREAAVQIARDPDCLKAICCPEGQIIFPCADNVCNSFCKNPACSQAWGCGYLIHSKGKAFLSNRKVEVVLSVDPLTRQIEVRSFKEIEVSAP